MKHHRGRNHRSGGPSHDRLTRPLSDPQVTALLMIYMRGEDGLNVWPKTPGVPAKSLPVLADRGLITQPFTCRRSLTGQCEVDHGRTHDGETSAFRRVRITDKGRKVVEAF